MIFIYQTLKYYNLLYLDHLTSTKNFTGILVSILFKES